MSEISIDLVCFIKYKVGAMVSRKVGSMVSLKVGAMVKKSRPYG